MKLVKKVPNIDHQNIVPSLKTVVLSHKAYAQSNAKQRGENLKALIQSREASLSGGKSCDGK